MLEDEAVISDLMINMAETLDTAKVSERLLKLDEELNKYRTRLSELMHLSVSSMHARKQIDDEIASIMIKSQGIQAEREKITTSIERSNLDARRLEEMKEFVNINSPLDQFDKDLFRKLTRHVVVHSRNEIEFVFAMGLSRRTAIGNAKDKEVPA